MLETKQSLVSSLQELSKIFSNDDHLLYWERFQEDYNSLRKLLAKAMSHINSLQTEHLEYNYPNTPSELIRDINIFFEKALPTEVDKAKTELGVLIKKGIQIANYCISIPNKKKKLRAVSEKFLDEELKKVRLKRDYIASQIKHKETTHSNPQEIHNLKETLKELEDQIESINKEKIQSISENLIEKDWEQRINDSFIHLQGETLNLELRIKALDTEYHLFLYALIPLFILIIIWLSQLYGILIGLGSITINNIPQLLPYYLPVPIFIAIAWICIIQKNRANKLLITLDEELFRIKYLQGLLLTINKLSDKPQTAIVRINEAISTMVDSYLRQTEKRFIDKRFSTNEKTESSIQSDDALYIIKDILTKTAKQ